jgi:radical SAM protein with 4Fe4S-binding SPASM domain
MHKRENDYGFLTDGGVLADTNYFKRQNFNKKPSWLNKAILLNRLDVELTERCNNNCIHCYINLPADDLAAKARELSTEEIKRILKEAVSLGCLTVRFTGGEPLLWDDFEELYVFARKLGLKVLLFTNATLIDTHLVELFSRIPPLEKIEVTLYGMHQNSYESVTRVPGSFKAAWRGVNLLLKNNIPFVVKQALLPPNKEEIDAFEGWAATIPWMDRPPVYSMFLDLRGRRNGKKNKLIKKSRLSPEQGLKILTRRKERFIKDMQEFCSKFMRPPGDKLFSCGAGHGGCVDAYGNFQPCMTLRHPDVVYDLRKGTLKDALTNFFPKLREMKADNPEYLARCARCFLKGLCEQCPAKSWMEHGTLDTPVEYLCEVAHTQARYLGLIAEDEKAWEVEDWRERIKRFVRRREAEWASC